MLGNEYALIWRHVSVKCALIMFHINACFTIHHHHSHQSIYKCVLLKRLQIDDLNILKLSRCMDAMGAALNPNHPPRSNDVYDSKNGF